MKISYSCDIPRAKYMSAARHGAGKKHACFRWYSTYANTVMYRGSSSPVWERRRDRHEGLNNCKKSLSAWRRGAKEEHSVRFLDEMGSLPLELSLAEWRSFLKKICKEEGVAIQNFSLTFTFELFYDLHLEV